MSTVRCWPMTQSSPALERARCLWFAGAITLALRGPLLRHRGISRPLLRTPGSNEMGDTSPG